MAAVLGHETGHVTAKHSLAGYQRAIASNVLIAGVVLGTGDARGSRNCRGSPHPSWRTASPRPGAGGGLDRDRLHGQGGIQPRRGGPAAGIFLHPAGGRKEPNVGRRLFRTHPFSKERLDNARARIAQQYPDTVKNPNYTFNEAIFRQKTGAPGGGAEGVRDRGPGDKLLKEKRYTRRSPGTGGGADGAGAIAVPLLGGAGVPGAEELRGRGEELRKAIELDGSSSSRAS